MAAKSAALQVRADLVATDNKALSKNFQVLRSFDADGPWRPPAGRVGSTGRWTSRSERVH
jgi:hypothetical protein